MGQLKTPFASEETHNKPICPDYADDCGTADSQNAYAETLKILNIKLELNPQFPWKLAGLSLFSRCYGMPVKLFHNVGGRPGLRVRLHGPPGNAAGVGAQVRLYFGEEKGPVREIHAGSGYWSQDSAIVVMGAPTAPTQIWIRWPGGKTNLAAIPAGALEISPHFR